MSMRILYISTWHPFPPDNGSKLRAYYLLKALSQSHEVSVITFNPEASRNAICYSRELDDAVEVWSVTEDPFRFVNLPSYITYLSPIPLSAWPLWSARKSVLSLTSGQKWDAVIGFQLPAARYALIPESCTRILDLDSSLSYATRQRANTSHSLRSKVKAQISLMKSSRYERRVAAQFDVCTVVSLLEVNYLKRLFGGTKVRVQVSPNGVDCDHNRPEVTARIKNRLVFNGSLTYQANHDAMRWFLDEIYPQICRRIPGITLHITGSTRGTDTTKLSLDETTVLTGYVEDVRIPVAGAEVCVIPLRLGTGTRLKILEAMALGTAVVSTAKGAEGLDVVNGEHLLIANKPEQFADKVIELLQDSALRQRLERNARQLVERNYRWDEIGRRFVALVERDVNEISAAEATSHG